MFLKFVIGWLVVVTAIIYIQVKPYIKVWLISTALENETQE